MTQFIDPPEVHKPYGYSHTAAVPAGTELVFLAGQVGVRPDGTTPETLAGQSEQMFANIGALLKAHGLDASHLVKITLYVVAGQDMKAVRAARSAFLGASRPTSTAVFISQLVDPKLFVECEAIAARPSA